MTEDNKRRESEPADRPDGEGKPPVAIDPVPDAKGIPPLPEPDVEGVGNEDGDELPPDQEKMVKDGTGF